MKTLFLYFFTLVVLFIIDLFWIGFIAKGFYGKYLGPLMASSFFVPAVVAFYILYAIGLLYFAVFPGIHAHSWLLALGNGAFLGFLAYMTYDLTNWGVLKNWAWQIVPVDVLWGVVLSGAVSALAFFVAQALGF